MRRYIIALLLMTLGLVAASFVVMYACPDRWLLAMPLLALYFGIVNAIQHWIVTRAMYRSPRIFVQQFLGVTVGVLVVHLAVIAIYLFTHPTHAKTFVIAFLVGFVVSWVFETVATMKFVRNAKKQAESEN